MLARMTGVELEISVLGPLQVRFAGRPVVIEGAKPRAVLTLLGLHTGQMVTADTLTALLWGEEPPRTARKALQTHISTLRRVLGDGVVVTAGTGWMLGVGQTDATRFVLAAERGRANARAGDPVAAVGCFDEALALWRGSPELCGTARSRSETIRWTEEQQALVEDRFEALLGRGHAATLIGELEEAVGVAPLRERRWVLLCHALYLASRQADALAAYQRARRTLARELGVEPGPALCKMQAAILAQDPSLEPAARHRGPQLHIGLPEVAVFDWSHELAGALASRYWEKWLVVKGSCVAVGTVAPPYSPLPAILNGIARDENGLEVLRRAAQVWPGVLKVPGVDEINPAADITTGLGQLHLFEALAWVLTRLGPVALVIEDLHLADEATLALIAYLRHNLHGGQVALLLSLRRDAPMWPAASQPRELVGAVQ